MGYHYVFGKKGPRAGRRWIVVDDAALADATDPADGWAVEMLPGVNMIADHSVPPEEWSEDWVIPGWNAPPAIVDPPWTPTTPSPPPTPTPVPVLSLWNTDPAEVVVASGDIGKFANGDVVTMAGVPVPYGFVNGAHTIANVGVPPNHFQLVGVDLSAAPANIGDAGMTATPPTPPAA